MTVDKAEGEATAQAKRRMRERMRGVLASAAPEDAWWLSGNACRRLAEVAAWSRARTVMVYAPLPDELNCTPAGMVGLECGVRVCVPRVNWEAKTLTPVAITDFNADLLPDRHGVRSPRPDLTEVAVEELEAILVPGLAFDRAGARLGRGGGFYDRLLAQSGVRATRIGMGFSTQVVERVPGAEHDERMHWVVTDLETIACDVGGAGSQGNGRTA